MLKKIIKIISKDCDVERKKDVKYKNQDLFEAALKEGLFDPSWYAAKIGKIFETKHDAFDDYLYRSRFSTISPSPRFDNESYIRTYPDVYLTGMSPLRHYLLHGRSEGRRISSEQERWIPKNTIEASSELSPKAEDLKIAIVLHIYYADFIKKFSKAISKLPVTVDIMCSAVGKKTQKKALSVFSGLENVREVQCVCVKNHGRNFGPLLVEFSQKLLKYDVFCHLHSKKSLFSGRENTQWADYLVEYLLLNEKVVINVLNAFAENEEYGISYPVPFAFLPGWVNHVLKNKENMKELSERFSFSIPSEFLAYPVGGMFWARPAALEPLLSAEFAYADFPEEPIPNDGTILHGIERSLGLMAVAGNYKQLFYAPDGDYFTEDDAFILFHYQKETLTNLQNVLLATQNISFDLFDTLISRECYVPDYAKLQLGQLLHEKGIVSSAQEYVALRNTAEFEIRRQQQFRGDVTIYDIYARIGELLGVSPDEAKTLAELEFDLDFNMIVPKDEMIDIFNELIDNKKNVFVVSDTYYTVDQIIMMLRKAGGICDCRFYISSQEKMRKDTGQLWKAIIKEKPYFASQNACIHVGDNVVSDCQMPGDLGIRTFHILSPVDKCRMMGMTSLLQRLSPDDEKSILKWGFLVSKIGRNPFVN